MSSKSLNVGIYSFPKAGTTWLTQVIGKCFGLEFPDGVHRYITDMHQKKILQTSISGFETTYRFYKSHRPRLVTIHRGHEIQTNVVLHIRRNPLDTFVSYMNYISGNVKDNAPIAFTSVDKIDADLLDAYFKSFTMLGSVNDFAATSGSYFDHNLHWLQKSQSPDSDIFCIKYEDLLRGPQCLEVFADRVGIPFDTVAAGYSETQNRKNDGRFYWKMKKNYFRDYLSEDQIAFFTRYRAKELELLGYEGLIAQ